MKINKGKSVNASQWILALLSIRLLAVDFHIYLFFECNPVIMRLRY